MATQLPTEDIRKIHSEINQIANQRFLISTAAVTVFGVSSAWIINVLSAAPSVTSAIFLPAVAGLQIVLLFMLFLLSCRHLRVMRIYSSYLVIRQESLWERDWKEFRKNGYTAFTSVQAMLFLLLGCLSISFPLVHPPLYQKSISWSCPLIALLILGLLYSIVVAVLGFKSSSGEEERICTKWKAIISPDETPEESE